MAAATKKFTAAANLAVALARAGRGVVLIDVDLRTPTSTGSLIWDEWPGLIDIQLGDIEYEHALRTIPISQEDSPPRIGDRSVRHEGTPEVLPARSALQAPDELGAELGGQDGRERAGSR